MRIPVRDVGTCQVVLSAFHQLVFYEVLDLFDGKVTVRTFCETLDVGRNRFDGVIRQLFARHAHGMIGFANGVDDFAAIKRNALSGTFHDVERIDLVVGVPNLFVVTHSNTSFV